MSNSPDAPRGQSPESLPIDEGGLRPPPGLSYWRRVWWWFDFLILVKLARLRFMAILVVIGVVITQWDLLVAYYEKWTRPAGDSCGRRIGLRVVLPDAPGRHSRQPQGQMPDLLHAALEAEEGASRTAEPLPAGVVNRVQLIALSRGAGGRANLASRLPAACTQGDHGGRAMSSSTSADKGRSRPA